MSKETIYLIGYCIFFTLCNINVSVFYYLYGFFFEKKLRQFDQCVTLPANLIFLFRFKGIFGTDRINASRSGALAQFGAIAYFFIMEAVCFLMVKLLNDTILPCRMAFLLFAVLIISGVIRIIMTNNRIRKNIKESDRLEAHLFVEENALNRDEADLSESDIFKEDSSKRQKMEMHLDMLWEEENDHENETTNAQEGQEAVHLKEKDVIGDDYEIEADEVISDKDRETAESLADVDINDQVGHKAEQVFKDEFLSGIDFSDDSKGEAEDFSLGKAYIDSLKKDVIGDDFDPVFDDSGEFN